MRISERIFNTIEEWQKAWQKRLKEWLISFLSLGIEVFFNVLGKALAPKLKPLIDTLEESGEVPPEFQKIVDELKEPTGEAAAVLGSALGYSFVGGAVGKITDALFSRFAYWLNARIHPIILTEAQYLPLWRRGDIKADELVPYLRKLGFEDDAILHLQKLSEIRLDPVTITAIWRRDKAKYEKFWKDLFDQGLDSERVDIMKELAKIIPPLADMVRFADFSAFDPEVIARWREYYDAPSWIIDPMSLIGIENEAPRDWANKYWFSHYVQPGRFELGEMFRRSEGWKLGATPEAAEKFAELGVSEDDVTLAYRTMAYSEFWQKRLLELAKAVPTRVDVRRWWDMRTIDENRLRELYLKQGYFGSDLEDYVLWTKVYVAFPDLIARFKNGWLTEDDVRGELTALGMPPERVDEMIETKVKKVKPERVAKERDLTKAEIVKGVKKVVIDYSTGIELLQDMGYDADEADFILQINVGAMEGSPESYTEFKQITQLYRKAMGLEAHIPPAELGEAEKALIDARASLREAEVKKLTGEKLAPYLKTESDAKYRYFQLLKKWQAEKAKLLP